ncbi:MAG: class I SAM-dependent methyltransferase [Rhodothermales bacterium]
MSSFKDHFSTQASGYARYRPGYPEALFAYLASCCDAHDLAWDCGTGNGQAAHGLAHHFARIIATDASADQIAHAVPHERIAYHVAPAGQSSLTPGSADLVTVAQAIHWFDFDRFYAEVFRVLKPGGVLAVWTYSLMSATPAIDEVVYRYYETIVGAYWPPERRLVENAYRTIPFPFEEQQTPAFHMDLTWSLDDVLGYLGTWSATARFAKAHRTDPVAHIRDDLAEAWGRLSDKKKIHWTLYLRVGRIPS